MSSSSSKRKQDEKNVKMLRELAAQPVNKQCFDCHQRGPTYVNMTIGSFVCTKCSGILRGLNPPHRVKSISMAAFTPDEIDFVKNRGNDYSKKVWLGLYDGDTRSFDNYNSDEQQMKDFLILKYERKRWYVNPAEIARQQSLLSASSSAQHKTHSPNQQSPPSSTTNGARTPGSLINTQSPLASPTQTSFPQSGKSNSGVPRGGSLDLFDSDPFSSPVLPNKPHPVPAPRAVNQQRMSSSSGGQFANFANFDAFASSPPPSSQPHPPAVGGRLLPPPGQDPSGVMIPKSATVPASLTSNANHAQPPPAPGQSASDKYSALAELDGLFSSGPTPGPTPGPGPAPLASGANQQLNSSWAAGTGTTSAFGGSGVFGSSPGTTNAFSNSFSGAGSHHKPAPPPTALPTQPNYGSSGNPFMTPQATAQPQQPAAFGTQWGQAPQHPQTAPAGGNPFFGGMQQQPNMGTSNPFGGLTPTPNSTHQAPLGQQGFGAQGGAPPSWGQHQFGGGGGAVPAWQQQNPFMGNQPRMTAMSQQQQGTNWNPFL